MLSKRQQEILKKLYYGTKIDEKLFRNMYGINLEDTIIQHLKNEKLVSIDSSKLYKPKEIGITERGRALVEENLIKDKKYKLQTFHIRANTVIAILALTTSIIALIVSLMQLSK